MLATCNRFALLCLASLVVLVGCNRAPPEFKPNRVYALHLEATSGETLAPLVDRVQAELTDLFGTPDSPRWPEELLPSRDGAEKLLDSERISAAAGAVASNQSGLQVGLYRKHCVNCHGVSGDGVGPASSFLNPYPRDFRHGVFKFKSTERGAKPTRADLLQTLKHGLRGTAMPAFSLLTDDELAALVDYVIYLSVRGETERQLLFNVAIENKDLDSDHVVTVLHEVESKWREAEKKRIEVTVPATASNDEQLASIKRGEELFRGKIANCTACHTLGGSSATAVDYDDWTKEWTSRGGLNPDDSQMIRPFLKAGALPPRKVLVRDLKRGVYRGGGEPADIYRRIVAGIDGTPMPAISRAATIDQVGVTESQIWDLVAYVMSLEAQAK